MQANGNIGLYIHIPFCKQACHYCDFHFSTLKKYINPWVNALITEMKMYKTLLSKYTLQTLYFGGGTPSMLNQKQWNSIFKGLNQNYNLNNIVEQTIEANPENVNEENLQFWQSLGFNRISIGIQTLDNQVLNWINRSHTARQAQDSIALSKANGYDNINIDIIYNIPSKQMTADDIMAFISLKIPHLSCYSLTIEENTVFGIRHNRNELKAIDEESAIQETELLWSELGKQGYEHYEISNFSLPGYQSVHNTNYWRHIPFLGLGSSAHSYINGKRWSNVSNNGRYIKALNKGLSPVAHHDVLTDVDLCNEKIMLGLRTNKGIAIKDIECHFHNNIDKDAFYEKVNKWRATGQLCVNNSCIVLTHKGKLIANTITQDLFRANSV